ncbi:Ni/Fe hydrogenase subunit alpha [Magnetovibrio blakemorei]|uniref:Dehydrogenase n=1 Tax=Magnetovibrio blakemorei TaxID=28181 RepID=A0A1E5Q4A6_9PROT|nr:Ni/Fe hydrogenase subunit alpha [Magnetovibrio blakemorei]OEJ65057.1 dehydrogenase [Magnetovibrio blakemorei]
MTKTTSRIIKVDALSRVEGEGALDLHIRDGKIKDLKFRIFEPPRFFEALLRGRDFSEAPDITSRICGICPIAYLLGSSQAMEDALGVSVTGPLRDLRRLIYCGEWVESHVLHAAMLHAPDFLELDDALQIAKANPELVKKALKLKKLGNEILEVVGGRAVHPVNLKVGGFYKVPTKARVRSLIEPLKWAIDASRDLALAFGGFEFPDYEYDYTCVSMRHPDEYAIQDGRIISNRGLDIGVSEFPDHFVEEHVAHSNALHGKTKTGEAYLVGPLARYNNNFDQLSKLAKATAKDAGLGKICINPFQSIIVRMVETLYAFEESLRIALAYEEPDASCVQVTPRAGTGHGCTEAPRGICYHRYSLDKNGLITKATIMPPTAQNQKQIEIDLHGVVERYMDLADEKLKWRCEQTIRNYDPCISCATHFLKLNVTRD